MGVKFGKFTRFEHLTKKVWQMNRFSQKIIIVRRNLMILVWQISHDSPNSPSFLPPKTFLLYGSDLLCNGIYYQYIFIYLNSLSLPSIFSFIFLNLLTNTKIHMYICYVHICMVGMQI